MSYIVESWSTKTPSEAATTVTLKKVVELFPGVETATYFVLQIEGFFPDTTPELLVAIEAKLTEAGIFNSSTDTVSY